MAAVLCGKAGLVMTEPEPIVVQAFRLLRDYWFAAHIARRAHEREWETEEDEAARERCNMDARNLFNRHTEQIIAGEDLPIYRCCPMCLNDLTRSS